MISGKVFRAAALGLLIILYLIVLAGCSPQATDSLDYDVSRYDVQVTLADDGSAEVTETVEFDLLKSRRIFEFNIPYAGAGSATLRQIAVSTGSDSSGQGKYMIVQPTNASNNGVSSAYEMQDDGTSMRIQVITLSEAGSRRKIRLTYILSRAVVLNADNAFLKREFFSSALAEKVEQTSLSIVLPTGLADIESWYLPVSQTPYHVSRPNQSTITFSGSPAAGEQDMILYCLMPETVIEQTGSELPGKTWEELVAEARQAASLLAETGTARTAVYYLVFILLALSTILVLVIFWFFDRESHAFFRHRYWYRLPDDCPPAILSLLVYKDRPGRLILATLFDLVRRGKLGFRGNVFSLPAEQKRDYSGYATFEIFLVQWLFDTIAREPMISTAEIRRYARDMAANGEMHEYFNQFRGLIVEEIEQRGLIDHFRIRRGRTVASLSSLLYLLMTVGSLLFLRNSVSLLLLIPTIFLALYAWRIRRLTPAGRELYTMTRALQRTIRDFGSDQNEDKATFFREMIPLSVALGCGSQLIDGLVRAGQSSADPYAEFDLDIYDIVLSSRPWREQVLAFGGNIKTMVAMLAASLLLSTDHRG